jgi:transposase
MCLLIGYARLHEKLPAEGSFEIILICFQAHIGVDCWVGREVAMATRQLIPEGAAAELAPMLKQAQSSAEFQRIQCVWLRAVLGLSAPQIAQALGWQADHVRHVQAAYWRQGAEALRDKPRGGRHHAHLTRAQEQELLAPFLTLAPEGGVLVIAPVQAAYEAAIGRPVHASVVYRALHRHGWRKIMPRPKHPKASPEIQEAFKKNGPRSSPKK